MPRLTAQENSVAKKDGSEEITRTDSGLKSSLDVATTSTTGLTVLNGDFYSASFVDSAVLDTANSDIRILTGSSAIVIYASIFGEGDADFSIFEAPTISVGNALTIYNLNRTSSNTSGVTITEGPTVSATGSVEILDVFIPSTIRKDGVPFATNTEFPRIFKPATEYLLRYTNVSGGTANISWVVQFGEL